MDDLDHLFVRLVENVRSGYAEYLSRPFEIAELYQTLVPYRHNRRELGIDTNGDYELALIRLLAGERGYLSGDVGMQEAIRRELETSNPNTAIFREFAASRVALAPDAVRRAEQLASGADSAGVTPHIEPAASAPTLVPRAAAFERSPERPPVPAADVAPRAAAPPPPPSFGGGGFAAASALEARSPAPFSAPPPAPPRPASSDRTGPNAPGTPVEAAASAASATAGSGTRPGAPAGVIGGNCRYCNATLPTGRRTVFCPHCGQNLTIQRCPACGTELELAWKYCITCGRGMTQA